MTNTWTHEGAIYTKGQDFTCEHKEDGVIKEVNGKIDYILQNRYYSLIVLTNGFEYILWTKHWLELNKKDRQNKDN